MGAGLRVMMAFSTVAGIASIAPFFAVLGDPHLINRIPLLHWLYQQLEFSSYRGFTVALGLAFMATRPPAPPTRFCSMPCPWSPIPSLRCSLSYQ
jgi:hypothetical protein